MFTGIITEVGRVIATRAAQAGAVLTIHAPKSAPEVGIGDSVAINGVCLTATSISSTSFTADVSAETLAKSTLSDIKSNDAVNLELAMLSGGRFGGHIVQGHVDGRGSIAAVRQQGESFLLTVSIPRDLQRYTVAKGSITINGISLTIAELSEGNCTIAVIPHTFRETVLHTLHVGSMVNIEVDILAKYVESMLGTQLESSKINENYLRENGFV